MAADTTSATQHIAQHIVRTGYDDLPVDVVDTTKWFLLDTFGTAWAGTNAPGAEELRRTVFCEAGDGPATVLADPRRLPASSAALLNGMYAGALDFDGVYEKGSVHPDIVTLPAAFAIAEMQCASGRDFLAALALGNDIACRSGGAMKGNKGWFNTATHGVFGAAAAAAKLLDMDEEATAHALGLAFAQCAGTQQALVEKSVVKRMLSGMAARAGVFAALAARNGITAPRDVFEGKFGFYALYGEGEQAALLDGIGETYVTTQTVTKKYPSCTANHVAIDAALALASEHDLKSDDIESIAVTISPFMDGLVGGPFDPGANPQVAAQFSVKYSIACAIERGQLGIAEIQPDVIADPTINTLAKKVSVDVAQDWPGKFAPCDLEITTRDGRRLTHHAAHTPGTRENPMGLEDLKDKFRDCAASGVKPMTTAQCNAAVELFLAIDAVEDMKHALNFMDD
ncbi:MAG: MmgE/PrpD family protein [Hyphomicrobiaceae bacterium]